MSSEQYEELPDAAPRPAAAAASSSSYSRVGASGTPDFANMPLTASDEMDKDGGGGGGDGGGNLIQKFRQMWITEKSSPELLYYESDVIEEVKFAVDERQKKLNELNRSSSMQFLCSLLQMELDRINFILHAYHRCRLKKLEKYATYIITAKQTDRCSPHELKFVTGYANLLDGHFKDSFLNGLPDKLASWFSLTPGDDPLIVKPDVGNNFVTFRVKQNTHDYPISEDEVVSLNENDIMVGNWRDFKALFTDGLIELL